MNRTRNQNQVDAYYNRDISLHKPGVIPNSSRLISPITANRHKYELKQKDWPKKTVESWFANHSYDERQAVYSFLNTVNDADETNQQPVRRRKSPTPRVSTRTNTASTDSLQRRKSYNGYQDSRASKRDLGEVLESLESIRPSSSVQEKGIQTSSSPSLVSLPEVNETKTDRQLKHPTTSIVKHTETIHPENPSKANDKDDTKTSRRYLSHTWRVINPREDVETNVRPDNNTSSFFNYTKKAYPEYFFIHPDWY